MEALPFIRVQSKEGSILLNLANVAAIAADENGSFGVRRRVTVHFIGGATMDFDDEYADTLSEALGSSGAVSAPRGRS